MKDAVFGIYFQFNLLGSEATTLFDIGRWTLDVRCWTFILFLVPTQEHGNER